MPVAFGWYCCRRFFAFSTSKASGAEAQNRSTWLLSGLLDEFHAGVGVAVLDIERDARMRLLEGLLQRVGHVLRERRDEVTLPEGACAAAAPAIAITSVAARAPIRTILSSVLLVGCGETAGTRIGRTIWNVTREKPAAWPYGAMPATIAVRFYPYRYFPASGGLISILIGAPALLHSAVAQSSGSGASNPSAPPGGASSSGSSTAASSSPSPSSPVGGSERSSGSARHAHVRSTAGAKAWDAQEGRWRPAENIRRVKPGRAALVPR